jgi:hypothetical protein
MGALPGYAEASRDGIDRITISHHLHEIGGGAVFLASKEREVLGVGRNAA